MKYPADRLLGSEGRKVTDRKRHCFRRIIN